MTYHDFRRGFNELRHSKNLCDWDGIRGLTLSVVLAECGHEVLGIEINMNTVDRLNSGSAFEKGLNSHYPKS